MSDVIIAALVAGLCGSGITEFIQFLINRYDNKHGKENEKIEAMTNAIKGLCYYQIETLCNDYIKRGYISMTEYANLQTMLYNPYIALGGNGNIVKVMNEIEKLPFTIEEHMKK